MDLAITIEDNTFVATFGKIKVTFGKLLYNTYRTFELSGEVNNKLIFQTNCRTYFTLMLKLFVIHYPLSIIDAAELNVPHDVMRVPYYEVLEDMIAEHKNFSRAITKVEFLDE